MWKNFKLLFIILLGAVSCQQEVRPGAGLKEYYDLEGLITAQVSLLDSLDPLVIKTVQVNNRVETESLRLKNEWSQELDIFKGVQINKPAFAGRYKASSYIDNEAKGIVYEPIDNPVSGIEYLKVSFIENEWDVEKVEVFYKDENLLYKSARKLVMNFTRAENKKVLQSYSITGSQKMVFIGLKTFKVEGMVLKN